MTTTTTTWTAPDPVVRQLSTREGFEQAVVPASAVTKALKAVLVIGVVLLAYNIFSTVRTLSENDASGSRFFEVFFSTLGTNGSTDPTLILIVWGPVVVIPVAAVLLIISMVTRKGRYETAFSSYSSGGFVASALGLPIPFTIGRDQFVPQVIVPGPDSTPEVAQWFDGLAATVQGLDKAGTKQLAKTLTRTLKKDDVAVPATTVFEGAPPFALLVRASNSVGAQTVRAVLPGTPVRAYVVNLAKVKGWS